MSIETRADTREALDDGQDAAQLLLDGDGIGTGAGGLAADVEDLRTLGGEPAAVRDRVLGGVEHAPVREGVGRDVDHAHDLEMHRLTLLAARGRRNPGGR